MIYSAEQARVVAETKVEENKKQSFEMVDNLIRITADCGKFSTIVRTDDIITFDILESLAKRYEGLGYKCEINSGTIMAEPSGALTISW